MHWFIRFVLLSSVILSMQFAFSMGQAVTPWESMQLSESFIANFLNAIAGNNAFSSDQKAKISSIQETLTEAFKKFDNSNTTSKIKSQAFNTVFASAIAEITTPEEGVNIEMKINAIENALNSAFLQTIGIINPQFVSKIKNLVYTLAHTTANVKSNASVTEADDYREGSFRQQVPFSSLEVLKTNGFVSNRRPGTEQQRLSTVDSFTALNAPGGPQGSSIQNPSEQQARRRPVAFSQGSSGSTSQKSSPQVFFVPDKQQPGDYRTGVSIAATTKGSGPGGQSSSKAGVNRLQQKDSESNKQIGPDIQAKSGVVSQTPGSNEYIASTKGASVRYGIDSVPFSLQGSLEKGPGILEPPIIESQNPSGYETRAAASTAVGGNEPDNNVKGRLKQNSSRSNKQEQSARETPVATGQRSEASNPGAYEWSATPSLSEDMTYFRPIIGTRQQEENKGEIGKDFKQSNSSSLRENIATLTDSYVTNTAEEKYQQERKDVQNLSGTGSQNERETQVQALNVYPPGTVAIAPVRISSSQAQPRQRSSAVEQQSLDTRKLYEVENRSVSPKDYGNFSAIAVAKSGYKSGNEANSQREPRGQEANSNVPATDGRNNYEFGIPNVIATTTGEYGATEPSKSSNISTPNGSSDNSSVVSSSISGSSNKPFKLSNTVSSIVSSQVSAAYPDLSYCNALIQTLLKIISELIHVLGSCNIGQSNFGTFSQ